MATKVSKRKKTPTRLSVLKLKNLERCWNAASEATRQAGAVWYDEAHEHAKVLANDFNSTVTAASGVIAALSPGSEWNRNLRDARTVFEAHRDQSPLLPYVGSYGTKNVLKAYACMDGADPLDVLGGPKVLSFYSNIANPWENGVVTIDRHAKGVLVDDRTEAETIVRTPKEYNWLADHYRHLAKKLAVPVHHLQATVWIEWRNGR